MEKPQRVKSPVRGGVLTGLVELGMKERRKTSFRLSIILKVRIQSNTQKVWFLFVF